MQIFFIDNVISYCLSSQMKFTLRNMWAIHSAHLECRSNRSSHFVKQKYFYDSLKIFYFISTKTKSWRHDRVPKLCDMNVAHNIIYCQLRTQLCWQHNETQKVLLLRCTLASYAYIIINGVDFQTAYTFYTIIILQSARVTWYEALLQRLNFPTSTEYTNMPLEI